MNGGGRELSKRGRRGRRSGDKERWREEGWGMGGGWSIYIINYDFITCSQFLGDLLFRGALMNNKKRGQRQRKAGGKEKGGSD